MPGSRVIALWTRAMLDETAPDWRRALDVELEDPAALHSDVPYIAHDDMVALWSRFTDAHVDPLFGVHFAERNADRSVGMFAYAAAHAPDFGTAARACIQLQRLIDTHGGMSLVEDDDGIAIRHVPLARWPPHLALSLAAGCVHLGRTFTGVHLVPRAAHFQHAVDGRDPSPWFGCPVHHDQPWNALVFDRATVALPFRHAEPTHFAAIVAAAARTLDAVAPPSSILDEARAVLRARKGRRVSIASLARELGVSERTLQRRLGEAGATFRRLVDEVRVELLAEEALKAQKGRATADAIGFADASSVRRLRKRWQKSKR